MAIDLPYRFVNIFNEVKAIARRPLERQRRRERSDRTDMDIKCLPFGTSNLNTRHMTRVVTLYGA